MNIKPMYITTNDFQFPHQEEFTKERLVNWINLSGIPHSCVVWNGHAFEVCDFTLMDKYERARLWEFSLRNDTEDNPRPPSFEINMHLYFPIDSRTTEKDWMGATSAYANVENNAWLPAHCDADHHHDREVEIKSAITAVFQPELDKLMKDFVTATQTKPADWPVETPWETAQVRRLKWIELTEFRDKVIKCAMNEVRGRYLGWYHQNPHLSHIHNIVHDCITTTLQAIIDEGSSTIVQSQIQAAAISLAPHEYETRWDQAARLKKEAAAAAAEATENE